MTLPFLESKYVSNYYQNIWRISHQKYVNSIIESHNVMKFIYY